MAGHVVVITSGKGGVGKTTTTANLAMALAQMGRRVVAIDADIGLRNLDVVLGLENRIVYDLVNVAEGACKLRQALIKDKRCDTLHLLPAAQTRDKTAITPDQMKTITAELKEEFDYVLVDSPAGIEQGFKNAIAGADAALIVTTPEVSAVRDADRIIGFLESSELHDPRLIINRVRPEMVRRGDMLSIDDVLEILSIELIGVIPDDEGIIVSTNRGEPVVLDPHSTSGQAYREIARRLEGESVPIVPPTPVADGWLGRLRRLIGLQSR
ncbi:MAG: septum site-determining protein MinD [Limnochordaceae bacterium]|nr:septum site-determining protein MinD [Limnochordaceae bacterium]